MLSFLSGVNEQRCGLLTLKIGAAMRERRVDFISRKDAVKATPPSSAVLGCQAAQAGTGVAPARGEVDSKGCPPY